MARIGRNFRLAFADLLGCIATIIIFNGQILAKLADLISPPCREETAYDQRKSEGPPGQ